MGFYPQQLHYRFRRAPSLFVRLLTRLEHRAKVAMFTPATAKEGHVETQSLMTLKVVEERLPCFLCGGKLRTAVARDSFEVMLRSFSVWNSTRPLHGLSDVIVRSRILPYCDFDS